MQMRRIAIFIVALGLTISGIGGSTVSRPVPGVTMARLDARIITGGSPVKLVRYGGYTIGVPVSWAVYHLGLSSTTCVDYARNALYLGRPGLNQDCPARVVGRVATISLQIPPAAGLSATGPAAARLPGVNGPATGAGHSTSAWPTVSNLPEGGGSVRADTQDHELYAAAGRPGLSITATYGSDAASVLAIIQSLRRTTSQPAMASPPGTANQPATASPPGTANQPATASRPARASQPAVPVRANSVDARIVGKGFDTCATPSMAAMQAWVHSFSYVGIYIGGAEVGCPYGNLSPAWVRYVRGLGWGLIPTYVGAQAPCNKQFAVRIQPGWASAEGQAAAQWAVQDAAGLGMGRGTPIYYDMESFNSAKAFCTAQVLSFLDGWTREIHALGYVSGVYSSAATGAESLGLASSVNGHSMAEPDSIWFAFWDGWSNVIGTPYLSPSWWPGYHRIKQYLGGHNRSVNGFSLNIDADLIRGPAFR
jgi:hypothetical protein